MQRIYAKMSAIEGTDAEAGVRSLYFHSFLTIKRADAEAVCSLFEFEEAIENREN